MPRVLSAALGAACHGVHRAQPASLCGGFTSRPLGPNHPGDPAWYAAPSALDGSLVEGNEASLGGASRRVVVVASRRVRLTGLPLTGRSRRVGRHARLRSRPRQL